MTSSAKINWLAPLGLIALSVVPVAAGAIRLLELGTGAPVRSDSARFFAAPLPFALHIICAVLFSVLGAFQFAAGLRQRYPHLHRFSGRVMVPCGLVVAFSALWMTQFYPSIMFDGTVLYVIRLLVAAAMATFLCLGVAAIRNRDFSRHRAWMMRGYALGLGAGTQVLTHIPWFMFPGIQGELARTLCMSAGWTINLAVTEWFVRAERHTNAAPVSPDSPVRPGLPESAR
jgi:uncharacterized membrane protein